MGENTKIEWADHTFNPWYGCQKVSEACKHCYAEAWAKRHRAGQGLWQGTRVRSAESTWRQPLRWNRAAERAGVRHRVFCASLADVFEAWGPETPGRGPQLVAWRRQLFELIRETPNLIWMLLTKRPENIAAMLPPDWGDGYPNVWLGTTVESQARADERIPHLLSVPARVRFLSMEPLLGPVDLTSLPADIEPEARRTVEGIIPTNWPGCSILDGIPRDEGERIETGIHWVITGGESGTGARPSHPDWFRSLRDQCVEADVAFHFKQWGRFRIAVPDEDPMEGSTLLTKLREGSVVGESVRMFPVGKEVAGRQLDGRTWDEVPA